MRPALHLVCPAGSDAEQGLGTEPAISEGHDEGNDAPLPGHGPGGPGRAGGPGGKRRRGGGGAAGQRGRKRRRPGGGATARLRLGALAGAPRVLLLNIGQGGAGAGRRFFYFPVFLD